MDYYKKLQEFDDTYGGETYATCFWVGKEEDFFESWLEDQQHLETYTNSIETFAGADGTGAMYAFWFKDGNTDPNKAPIIFYGSEGEVVVMACHLRDLLQMLSCGEEPMDSGFYRGYNSSESEEEHKETFENDYPNFLTFREWMNNELEIEPVDNWWKEGENEQVDALYDNAQKEYAEEFKQWNRQFMSFYDEEEEEERTEMQQQAAANAEEKELLQQLEEKPTASLYVKLAEIQFKAHQWETEEERIPILRKQQEYYEKALALDPNNPKIILNIVDGILSEKKEYPKAISLLLQLEKEHPKEVDFFDLALCYERTEQYDKAFEYYEKAILLDEEKIQKSREEGKYPYISDLNQGKIIKLAKKLKKDPIAYLEKIIAQVDSQATFDELQKLYVKKKHYTKAVELFKRERKYSHDQQGFKYTDFLYDLFDKKAFDCVIDGGLFSLQHMEQDDSRLGEVHNVLGAAHVHQYISDHDTDEVDEETLLIAKAYYQKAVALDPEESEPQDNLAWVENELKKYASPGKGNFFKKLFGK